MARTAIGRGQAAILGQGLNKFNWVDNEERAAYILLSFRLNLFLQYPLALQMPICSCSY